jgi:hypothetical protein
MDHDEAAHILKQFAAEKEYLRIRTAEARATQAAHRERRAGRQAFVGKRGRRRPLDVLRHAGNPELADALAAVQHHMDRELTSLAAATERLEEQIANGRPPTLAQTKDAIERSDRIYAIEERFDRLVAAAAAWLDNHPALW